MNANEIFQFYLGINNVTIEKYKSKRQDSLLERINKLIGKCVDITMDWDEEEWKSFLCSGKSDMEYFPDEPELQKLHTAVRFLSRDISIYR